MRRGTKHRAILGLAGFDHDGSATLLDGGTPWFLEAERPSRRKNVGFTEPGLLAGTVAALPVGEVGLVALGDHTFVRARADWLEPWLADRFPAAEVRCFPHHDCHLASAFWSSGWDEALVVSVDGKGDGLSACAALMDRSGRVGQLLAVPSASSLGRLWWAATRACGLGEHHDAGKTMAWAALGEPRHADVLRAHLTLHPDGGFTFAAPGDPLRFRNVDRFAAWLAAIDAEERRDGPPGSTSDPDNHPAAPRFPDLAASVQVVTEEVLLHLIGALVRRSGVRRACLAGGVALNGLANQRLLDAGVVDALHVPPFPDDRGLSFGAAALGAVVTGQPLPNGRLAPFLGPRPTGGPPPGWRAVPGDPLVVTAEMLEVGGCIASVQGREEAGPRALGNRSILASPVRAATREHLNGVVKRREAFRPFGCTVLAERGADWLSMDGDSPYMLRIVPVRAERRARVPAIVHADGTTRPQTVTAASHPRLHALLRVLEARGHPPLLLNTSLNGRGEPIAHDPADAFSTAARLGLDGVWTGDALYVPASTPMSVGS